MNRMLLDGWSVTTLAAVSLKPKGFNGSSTIAWSGGTGIVAFGVIGVVISASPAERDGGSGAVRWDPCRR